MKRYTSRRKRDKRRIYEKLTDPCKHQWISLGTESLHAGHKPKGKYPYFDKRMPIVKQHHIYQCAKCKEWRVKTSSQMVYGRKEGIK